MSSALTLAVPSGFGYVGLAALAQVFLSGIWQTALVSKTRKASGIKYPQLYATEEQAKANPAAQKFNCAQRAHQNTLEGEPAYFVTLFLAGLQFPVAAAAAGAVHILGRIFYTRGYLTGKPERRAFGSRIDLLARIALLGYSVKTVYDIVARGL